MDFQKEIDQIDAVIVQLRGLKGQLKKTKAASDRAFNTSHETHTRRAIQNANANLDFACMNLHQYRKATWKAIKDAAFLEVDLGPTEYHPGPFQVYKG